MEQGIKREWFGIYHILLVNDLQVFNSFLWMALDWMVSLAAQLVWLLAVHDQYRIFFTQTF